VVVLLQKRWWFTKICWIPSVRIRESQHFLISYEIFASSWLQKPAKSTSVTSKNLNTTLPSGVVRAVMFHTLPIAVSN
jgi:hypothetical protein